MIALYFSLGGVEPHNISLLNDFYTKRSLISLPTVATLGEMIKHCMAAGPSIFTAMIVCLRKIVLLWMKHKCMGIKHCQGHEVGTLCMP